MESSTYVRGDDQVAVWTGDGRDGIAQALFAAVPDLETVTLTTRQWMVLEVWTPGFEVPDRARRAVDDVCYPGWIVLYNSGFQREMISGGVLKGHNTNTD